MVIALVDLVEYLAILDGLSIENYYLSYRWVRG